MRVRALAVTLVLVVGLAVAGLVRWSPPAPLPASAPEGTFSGARAYARLVALVGDAAPRTTGSAALARARAVAIEDLTASGFRAEAWAGSACNGRGICGFVTNVVARRDGTSRDAGALLLVAHLDSVAAGPGAGDDGIGASTLLEVARALGASAPLARPVVVLLSDGEEAGLLGALAFATDHPMAKEIDAVVNVDARGPSGPSMLFEVEGGLAGTQAIVDAAAKSFRRPVTSSLFAEVYRRMPNDTDFSVFRGRARGVNFGNIAGVARYHTARDVVGEVDVGTLQHGGEQALAMARAFGSNASPPPRGADAVWFDVLGLGIVSWPASWTLPLAVSALLLQLAARRRALSLAIAKAALLSLGALLVGLAAPAAIGALLRLLGALPAPWIAHPTPLLATVQLAAGGSVLLVLCVAGARVTAPDRLAGVSLLLASLGVAVAGIAPGASHLFVVPALVAGAFALGRRHELAGAATTVSMALLWLPLVWPLYLVLGTLAPPVLALPVALVVLPLASLLDPPTPRPRVVATVLAAALLLVGTIAAVLVPPFSAEVPQRVNVVVRQDDDGPSWVMTTPSWGPMPWGDAPPEMVAVAGPAGRTMSPLTGGLAVPARESPTLALPPPAVTVLGAEGGETRLHVRSPRGAQVVILELASDEVSLAVGRQHVRPVRGLVVLHGVPAEGVTMSMPTRFAPTLTRVLDRTAGVDASPRASAIARARPVRAVTTQDGDVTIRATTIRW